MPSALKFGGIGDSIMHGFGLGVGEDPLTQCGLVLATYASLYSSVVVTNRAIDGTQTSDWLSGSSNLNAAKTAFAAASVTDILILLAANDAATVNHVAAATYQSNLLNICADLIAAGYRVILNYPTYIPAGANGGATDAISVTLTQAYLALIDQAVNGTTRRQGDTSAWDYFRVNYATACQSDQTHPTAAGAVTLGTRWADNYIAATTPRQVAWRAT